MTGMVLEVRKHVHMLNKRYGNSNWKIMQHIPNIVEFRHVHALQLNFAVPTHPES